MSKKSKIIKQTNTESNDNVIGSLGVLALMGLLGLVTLPISFVRGLVWRYRQ